MRPARSRFGLVVLLGAFTCGAVAQAAPKAKVSLVPFASAATAGKPIELGIGYELESGWHIYWQNPGDAGAAPSITWSLPEGFKAGELLFPAPKKHVSPGDIITNVLKGEPVLLTTIQTPETISGSEIAIKAKVVSFVCDKECIQEVANVDVKLPVAATADDVKPTNEDVLAAARKKLPKAASKIVSVKPEVSTAQVTPGSKFDVLVKATIAPKHHIQSNAPTVESVIPAEIFLQKDKGLRFEKAQFPEAKSRQDKYLGELKEFGGAITIKVPAEVDAQREPGPLKIAGVFSYQACEDGGNCLPPEAIGFSLPLEVVAVANNAAAPALAENSPTSGEAVATTQPATNEAPNADIAATAQPESIDGVLKRFGLFGLLVGCFLYGLFVNATPCVLPLLSIKVLGFVQQAHESRKKTVMLGLAFGAGVIVFFVALGLLAAKGENIQQKPFAVIVLGGVVLAMALSMLGVFTLHVPTSATSLEARINQEGPLASFAKGAFAPVLGLACTGPLLAGAFAWASQQPRETAILAFSFMGLGMASPYMLLGAYPRWLSFLPRPGMWMIKFSRISSR